MTKDIDWVGSRPLRHACILSFFASMALAIPPSVIEHQVLPGLGLLPLFGSAAVSGVLLRIKTARLSPVGVFAADSLLAASLIVVYVFTLLVWSNLDGHWSYPSDGITILAAYATVPMLVSICTHVFFAIRAIRLGLRRRATPQMCPNCAHQIQPQSGSRGWFRRVSGESARLLAADDEDDNEPRYRDVEEGTHAHGGKEPAVGITGQTAEGLDSSGNGRATLSFD